MEGKEGKTLEQLVREAVELVGPGVGVELWADRSGGYRARIGGLGGAGGTLEIAVRNALDHHRRVNAYPQGGSIK